MIAERQKAVALTTTPKNNQHSKDYRNFSPQSRVKLQENLAEILLYLQTPLKQRHREKCWHIFESKLRRFIDLKICGGMV